MTGRTSMLSGRANVQVASKGDRGPTFPVTEPVRTERKSVALTYCSSWSLVVVTITDGSFFKLGLQNKGPTNRVFLPRSNTTQDLDESRILTT